ncbi:MAG: hypothetical protein A2X81_19310 [Desulfobacterales bacterium GWB2_56_26]|nr:MAG: hypothetical protein A2X81_19310 [Desulfobacterales bacterium GWB2_56_26]
MLRETGEITQLEDKKQETADFLLQVRITAYLEYFLRARQSQTDRKSIGSFSVCPSYLIICSPISFLWQFPKAPKSKRNF